MSLGLPLPISPKIRPFRILSNFVGRQLEISLLSEALQSRNSSNLPNVALIQGNAGVGKTELALVVIQRLRWTYTNAQFIIEANHTQSHILAPQHILETIIHSLDPFVHLPNDMQDLQALYYSLLVGKRCLILIDGLEDVESLTWLIPPPTCALLVTSTLSRL